MPFCIEEHELMKPSKRFCTLAALVFVCVTPYLSADGPTIPPGITRVTPAGVKRGSTVLLTIEGRNLAGAKGGLFDAPGLTGKGVEVRDLPEEPGARSPFNQGVPLGVRQQAKVQLTVAADVETGLHQFRIDTPLGTSKLAVLDVGALPEIQESEPNTSGVEAKVVSLPATIMEQ